MNNNIRTPIFIESRYKVNRKRIEERVRQVLGKYNIPGNIEVSIAIVGDRKMKILNKKYRQIDKTTNVLSFSQTEGQETVLPSGFTLLGDIVISYPQVIREAAEKEVFVDDRICDLIEHGLNHLLGMHHE